MRARAMPSTTGSTASRCDGFAASPTGSVAPERDSNTPSAPRWYLTSPEPWIESGSTYPSNSRKSCAYDLPTMLASTLSRPRCDMPITAESRPWSAACSRMASRIGISDSAPSRPKRFWPRYLVPRNFSNASAALSRSRMWRWSSTGSLEGAPSTCSWIQRFSSGSWMCMYSMPTVRQ